MYRLIARSTSGTLPVVFYLRYLTCGGATWQRRVRSWVWVGLAHQATSQRAVDGFASQPMQSDGPKRLGESAVKEAKVSDAIATYIAR